MAAAAGLTGHSSKGSAGRLLAARARLDGPGREPGIDLARGLAVIGMLAAHLHAATAFDWAHPATWTDVVNGRSSILFATLAGVSLALVTGGAHPFAGERMAYARGSIALRGACIWLLGLLLLLLQTPVLVILPAYAILFLLTLPALRMPPGSLFAAAAAIAVTMPFAVSAIDGSGTWDGELGQALEHLIGWHYPFLLWAAFVFAGMALGRMAFSRPSTAALLLAAGVVLAAVGYGVVGRWASVAPPDLAAALSSDPHSGGMGEAIGSGGFAIAVIALCTLVCATPARILLLPLRAVGSMPLTAYTAQLVAWALVSPATGQPDIDLRAFHALEPFWPMTIATILGCTAWALLVGRGPLERLIGVVARTGPREEATPAR